MINKQYLIKLTGENNIWFDSEQKLYIRRNICPICGVKQKCLCYHNLEEAEVDESDNVGSSCSYRCSLQFLNDEVNDFNLQEYKYALGITHKLRLKDLMEEQCKQIVQSYYNEADFDYESPMGEFCR